MSNDAPAPNKKRQTIYLTDPLAGIAPLLKSSPQGLVYADLARPNSNGDSAFRVDTDGDQPPRHDYWAKLSTWEPHEAAAQLLGIDPDCLSRGAAQKRADLSPRAREFFDVLRVLRRAIAAGDISDKRPTDYLSWAKGRFAIPEALAEAVRALTLFPTAHVQSGKQHRESTSLTVIVGLALKLFPDKDPFSTAALISGICERHGLRIHEDTVRSLLKRARDLDIKRS